VFIRSGSASIDADGVQVVDLDASGHQVGTLPESLAYPDWWHPIAGTDVLGTVGGVRSVASNKTVVRCDLATSRCTTLAGGRETSAFGAVPTATGFAYLSTANSGNDTPGNRTASLWLAAANGSAAHRVISPATVSQVVASAGGRTLLLVGADSVACPSGLPADQHPCFGPPAFFRFDGHTAIRLANANLPTNDPAGYYGHVTEIVSWSQPQS
ncbi:MAG: hypothetical protein ACRDTP_08520, partial [Mycobacteriales bacterium]